jgi:hypothetical protein
LNSTARNNDPIREFKDNYEKGLHPKLHNNVHSSVALNKKPQGVLPFKKVDHNANPATRPTSVTIPAALPATLIAPLDAEGLAALLLVGEPPAEPLAEVVPLALLIALA